MELCKKRELMKVASGESEPDFVLKNARVVDVFTEQVYQADIAVSGGYIAGVGTYNALREINLHGRYVCPGFIDAHVHIESSMVSPSLFASRLLPCGTTTIIADPHEIVNVAGTAGMEYMLRDSEKAAVNIYFVLPSCVPVNENDHNGAIYDVEQMKQVLSNPRVVGLGEVMDYHGVTAQKGGLLQKIELLQGKNIDGHAPGLSGKELQAYALAGVQTDHECDTYQNALEKLRAGMLVQIREGSAARNLQDILSGALADGISLDRFLFCTDDMHLADLERQGNINHNLRRAVALGVPPVKAVKMATLNAARAYHLPELGAVAPGCRADLVVLEDLEKFQPAEVYKDGIPWKEKNIAEKRTPVPEALLHSVHLPDLAQGIFRLPADEKEFPVIGIIPGQIVTRREMLRLPQKDGFFVPQGDLLKVALIQRHDGTGRTGVGVVRGFGLKNGALASTVGHDAHNLIVIGDNDADMMCAVEELRRCNGGYTAVSRGKVQKTVCLPVAGLFTDDTSTDLVKELQEMEELCHRMGVPESIDAFQNLSFLSLPVIPEIRIMDIGLYDVLGDTFLQRADRTLK